MNIGELQAPKRKNKKRVGRGPGSGMGKTSTRGQKGQRSRSGFNYKPGFEGGQMPLQRRIPKRGFKSQNRIEYQIVNIACLEQFESGKIVDPQVLKEAGLVKHTDRLIKVLGGGDFTKKLSVTADKFSQSALDKITQAGGEVKNRELIKPAEDAA